MHGGATAVPGSECAEAVALAVSLRRSCRSSTPGAASAGMLSINAQDAPARSSERVCALLVRPRPHRVCMFGNGMRRHAIDAHSKGTMEGSMATRPSS